MSYKLHAKLDDLRMSYEGMRSILPFWSSSLKDKIRVKLDEIEAHHLDIGSLGNDEIKALREDRDRLWREVLKTDEESRETKEWIGWVGIGIGLVSGGGLLLYVGPTQALAYLAKGVMLLPKIARGSLRFASKTGAWKRFKQSLKFWKEPEVAEQPSQFWRHGKWALPLAALGGAIGTLIYVAGKNAPAPFETSVQSKK